MKSILLFPVIFIYVFVWTFVMLGFDQQRVVDTYDDPKTPFVTLLAIVVATVIRTIMAWVIYITLFVIIIHYLIEALS